MNYQEKVLEFQVTAGEDFTKGLTPLREELLREEIAELEEAIKNNDRVEILDALCDIIYVALGTCNVSNVNHKFYDDDYYDPLYITHERTVQQLKEYSNEDYCISSVVTCCYELANLFNFTLDNFKTALDRVHASNMSKFCNTEQEAVESVISYKEQGIDVYSKQVGYKWVIYRLSDNKVLKSKYYHRVDLTDLV